jgi:hypothetical protein
MNYKYLLSLGILVLIMIACNPLKWINKSTTDAEEKRDRLMKTGVSAEGKITKIEEGNEAYKDRSQVIFYIHVTPKKGDEFDVTYKTWVSGANVARKGDIVTVWYDPNNKNDIIVEGFLPY